MNQSRARLSTTPWALSLGVLAAAAALIWIAVFCQPDGRLHVVFFDVGQGDAILIKTPVGRHVLVDGGASPDLLAGGLGREMPFWQRSLDAVILTHPHEDHLAGLLEVMERYEVKLAIYSTAPGDGPAFQKWEEYLQALPDDSVRRLDRGDWVDLGRGVRLSVLHPPAVLLGGTRSDTNNNSLVLELSWGDVSFLLAGDVEAEGQRELIGSGHDLGASVLKVPHQGAADSLDDRFLQAVGAEVAVISVGPNNRYGHPAPVTLQKLAGIEVYRTDQDGTVRVTTDGLRYWVTAERQQRQLRE